MIEVEVFGASLAPEAPSQQEICSLCEKAAASMGVLDAHVAIEFVDGARIEELNSEYRDRQTPTDVLSFPIDGVEPLAGAELPRELGDVVICPQHTVDLREAIVHGMLHLLGMDHETDDGEMLALQGELLAGVSE
jgi:probable rRNA maturation factor